MDPRKTDCYSIITFLIFCYISKACFANAFPTPNEVKKKRSDDKSESEISRTWSEIDTISLLKESLALINRDESRRKKRQLNIIQSKIVDIVHPKPIVDTIKEEEKYGNTVDHAFGRKIVKTVENMSNIINSLFAFPVNTVKKASRSATEVLNQIGSKIVGLQK